MVAHNTSDILAYPVITISSPILKIGTAWDLRLPIEYPEITITSARMINKTVNFYVDVGDKEIIFNSDGGAKPYIISMPMQFDLTLSKFTADVRYKTYPSISIGVTGGIL